MLGTYHRLSRAIGPRCTLSRCSPAEGVGPPSGRERSRRAARHVLVSGALGAMEGVW
jgi:hypothetical protein